jgi:hypothetical protein
LLIAWLAYRTFFVGEPPASTSQVSSEVQHQNTTSNGAEIASGASVDIGRVPANVDRNSSGLRQQWSTNFGSNAQANASDVRLSLSAPAVVRRSSQFRITIDADAARPVNRGTFKIRFNPMMVMPLSTGTGTFMEQGNALAKVSSTIDSEHGLIEVELEQDGGQGVEGAGSMVTIEFQALSIGRTELQVLQSEILDGSNNALRAAEPATAYITIGD